MLRQPLQPLLRPLLRRIDEQASGWLVPSMSLNFLSDASLDTRVTFTRASSATRINSEGLIETVASNAPRFDYDPVTLQPKGLLIEEQRTNLVRNGQAIGASVGTPGTLPTNWSSSGPGLNYQVVETGTESGLSYVDIRIYGTSTSNYATVGFDNGIVGYVTGTPYSGSAYVSIISGSTTGISQALITRYNLSAGGSVDISTNFALTSGPLIASRVSNTGTISGAITGTGIFFLILNFSIGKVLDVTLRVAFPQLEAGAFPTSYIPTTTAAATRAADGALMTGANFSSWYRQDEGTLFAETDSYPSGGSAQRRILYTGTSSDRMDLRFGTDGVSTGFNVVVGGVAQAAITGAGTASLTKIAAAYKVNDFAAATNSVLGTPDTSGSLPAVSQLAIGSNGSSEAVNGHIRRIAYFPRRLSNAELQGITA